MTEKNVTTLRIQTVLYENHPNELRKWLKSVLGAVSKSQLDSYIYIGVNGSSSTYQRKYVDIVSELNIYKNIFLHFSEANLGHGQMHNVLFTIGRPSNYLLICNPDGLLECNAIERFFIESLKNDVPTAYDARQLPYDHPKIYDKLTLECGWLSGSCLFLRSTDFERIQGFDPTFFLHCDDIDLSFRLSLSGVSLKHLPSAIFYHNKNVGLNGYVKQSHKERYYNQLGALLLAKKWNIDDGLREMLRELRLDGSDEAQKILQDFYENPLHDRRGSDTDIPAKFNYFGGWRFSRSIY